MSGVLYPPAFVAITGWFTTRRLGALATLTLVAGLASTVFARLVATAGAQLGWRGTYLWAAAVLAILTIPAHALVLRRPWPASDHARDDARAAEKAYTSAVVATTQFRLLTIGLTAVSVAMYAALLALVPLMLERGLTAQSAAWPRWFAIFANPLTLVGVGTSIATISPEPLHTWLGGAAFNLGLLVIYTLSTILLWQSSAAKPALPVRTRPQQGGPVPDSHFARHR